MKGLTLRALNILAVLAAVAWLAREPSFAALATFLPLLAILVGQEISVSRHSKNSDTVLFEKFISVLPSDGQFLYFLKEHDIGAPFRRHVLDEMHTFLYHWGNAEHEFKKKCVEESRKKLYDLTAEFSSKLSLNIFPDGIEFYSMGINDWEDRPDRLRVRDELNAMATTLYSCHQDLVRLGKKYFA